MAYCSSEFLLPDFQTPPSITNLCEPSEACIVYFQKYWSISFRSAPARSITATTSWCRNSSRISPRSANPFPSIVSPSCRLVLRVIFSIHKMSEFPTIRIAHQLTDALKDLHSIGYIHRLRERKSPKTLLEKKSLIRKQNIVVSCIFILKKRICIYMKSSHMCVIQRRKAF